MIRHFLGSDPCAKPAPHGSHQQLAVYKTHRGIADGRTYQVSTDGLKAEIRKEGGTWILSVERPGGYSHTEMFGKANQASDRWLALCTPEPEIAAPIVGWV
jgi:hypothetical protein